MMNCAGGSSSSSSSSSYVGRRRTSSRPVERRTAAWMVGGVVVALSLLVGSVEPVTQATDGDNKSSHQRPSKSSSSSSSAPSVDQYVHFAQLFLHLACASCSADENGNAYGRRVFGHVGPSVLGMLIRTISKAARTLSTFGRHLKHFACSIPSLFEVFLQLGLTRFIKYLLIYLLI